MAHGKTWSKLDKDPVAYHAYICDSVPEDCIV